MGVAILATARWLDSPEPAPAAGYRMLDSSSAAMLEAIVPVVLAGTLPGDPAARARATRETIEAFDRAVAGLSAAVQREVGQLFSAMRFAPSRIALTGLWSAIEESPPHEIAAFLTRWRESRFDIPRAGYQALTQLIQAAWYDNPSSWAAIGYPGPPSLRLQA